MKKINFLFGVLALLIAGFLSSCNTNNKGPVSSNSSLEVESENKNDENNKTYISGVTFNDKEVTYDGKEHSIYIEDNLPSEVNVEYENNGKINAGEYTVTAKLVSSSPDIVIEQEEFTATLKINKKKIEDVVTFNDYTVEYNKGSNYIYAENVPEGVEVNYKNNGQTDVGDYIVEAEFIDSTGNYDCNNVMTAELNITKSSLLKKVEFYNENGELLKTIEVMNGEYITSDLMPTIKYETGYDYKWDYDFYTPVTMDLYIHLSKVGKPYVMKYYHDDTFDDAKLIKTVDVEFDQVIECLIQEYDLYTYAYKYKVYHKDINGEYEPLLDDNEQEIIVDMTQVNRYNYLENVYFVALKDSRNIDFEYQLNVENDTAVVTGFLKEEVIIPRAIYKEGHEYIIEKIGDSATEAHAFLTSLKFTNDSELKIIGDRAFKWSILEEIELPNTIEYIGEEAFYASKLSSLLINDNVYGKEIVYGFECFGYIDTLVEVRIPKWENKDLSNIFGTNSLDNTKVQIDYLMMIMENYPSLYGSKIKTLSIGEGTIETGLNNIPTIDNLYLDKNLFFYAETRSVNNVYVNKTMDEWIYSSFNMSNLNPAYNCDYFYTYENDGYVLCPSELALNISPNRNALSGIKQITKITFNEGIKEIYDYSCSEIPNLEEVSIPSSVETIGEHSFLECKSLEKVKFGTGSKLKTIKYKAFYLSGLKEITLPSGLENIEDLSFSETYLSEIVIPNSVKTIGYGAFSLMFNLKTVTFEKESSLSKISSRAFASFIDEIYFGMSEEKWKSIEFDFSSRDGLFLYDPIPKGYFLNENGTYYLVDIIYQPDYNI